MRNFRHLTLFFAQVWLSLMGLTGLLNTVHAHQTGNSYLIITESTGQLQVEFDFIARDLDNLLSVDCKPAEISLLPENLQAMQACITQALQKSLHLQIDEQDLPLAFNSQSVVMHSDGLYVRQQFTSSEVPQDAKFLVIKYEFFTQKEQSGRAFVKIELRNEEISSVVDQNQPIQRFALGDAKRWSTIGLFTREGARHIWEGTDHLLFLLSLLLPGLMLTIQPAQSKSNGNSWTDSPALRFALKVITAFTIAHSITLAFSVFGWVSLPEKWIESMIAFSIMVSALLNLQDRFRFSHWKIAFLFGLIHGMGFANGLKDLGLSSFYFLETLFAFNLGVELGQLSAVTVVALPVLLLVRQPHAKKLLLKYGSIATFVMASVWLVERLIA
jgi:HupE / UreJ protein